MPFLPFKCELQTANATARQSSRDILGFAVNHEKPDAKGLYYLLAFKAVPWIEERGLGTTLHFFQLICGTFFRLNEKYYYFLFVSQLLMNKS